MPKLKTLLFGKWVFGDCSSAVFESGLEKKSVMR